MTQAVKKHTVAVLLENESGALSSVVGLFSQRNYNIESLTVAPTHDPSLSRVTIVTFGSDSVSDQIVKQLNRLVFVYKVIEFTDNLFVHEIALVRIRSRAQLPLELTNLVGVYGGSIVEVGKASCVVRLLGSSQKIDDFLNLLEAKDIIDMARSGAIALASN